VARRGLLETFLLNLSQLLPQNPLAILVLATVAFATMFRLLEKLDAQAEWPEFFNQSTVLSWTE
jgi:type II secretory pathway component PulF